MKPFVFSLLLVAFSLASSFAADAVATHAPATAPKQTLTLDEAKTLALHGHPSLEAMRQRVMAAAAAVRIARSAYWPTLDANAAATRVQDHSYVGMPSAFAKMIDMTPYSTYSGDLTAGWLIFDGFRREFDVLAAQHGETATRNALTDAQRLLLQAVSMTYCQALLAHERMRIAQDDATFSASLLFDASNRFAAGVAPRSEVLSFENRREIAESQRVEANKSSRTARVALAELLAYPGGDIADNVVLVLPDSTPAPVPGADATLTYAIQHRPDLQSAEAQAQAAHAQRHSADAAWWPRISAVGQSGLAHDQNLKFKGDRGQNLMIGVQATWNIFGGGRDSAARDAAEAGARAAVEMKSALALKVAAEVRQNLAALDASRAQLDIQARVLDRSRQIRDLVRQEYLGGTAGVTRMNEVQNEAVNADTRLVMTRIDNLLNRENLDAVTGKSLEGTTRE